MKLLIDEDLSPRVALHLCNQHSLDAAHVRDRGMLGETDQVVLERVSDIWNPLPTCWDVVWWR